MSVIDKVKKHINEKILFSIAFVVGLIIAICIQKEWSIMGFFCGCVILFVYFLIVFCVWKECGIIAKIKECTKKQIFGTVLLIIFVNLCIISIMLKENYIRFWDYVGYWAKAIMMSDLIVANPLQMFQSLYQSINTDNYSNLIPCIMALPLKILGKSFTMYVLIILNMFLIPAFLTIIFTVINITEKMEHKFQGGIVPLVVFTMPVLIQPVLYGYVDAFALVVYALLFLILFSDIFEHLTVKRDILIACLLLLCLMGRRYFAYAIIGYVLCVVLVCLRKILMERNVKIWKYYFFHGAVIVVSFFAVIMLGFFPFLQRSFSGTVAVDTAAYQKGNILLNYKLCGVRYGYFFILLAVMGVIVMLIKKSTRMLAVCACVCVLVPCTLFYRMQSMNMHHYYITAVPIIVCISVAFHKLWQKKIGKICGLIVISVSILLSFDAIKINSTIAKAFSEVKLVAKCRNDIGEIQRMVGDIKKNAKEGKTTYVLASEGVLNDDILRRSNMPEELTITPYLLVTSHVDLRHGFPEHFLTADYVIVTNPVQAHLGEENQHIIVDLVEEFVEQKQLSKNYEKIETYELDQGVEAYLYKRVKEISKSDKSYLQEIFDGYYPDYPELFHDRLE